MGRILLHLMIVNGFTGSLKVNRIIPFRVFQAYLWPWALKRQYLLEFSQRSSHILFLRVEYCLEGEIEMPAAL